MAMAVQERLECRGDPLHQRSGQPSSAHTVTRRTASFNSPSNHPLTVRHKESTRVIRVKSEVFRSAPEVLRRRDRSQPRQCDFVKLVRKKKNPIACDDRALKVNSTTPLSASA